MFRRWCGTLNFSMSAPEMKRVEVMERVAACMPNPARIALGLRSARAGATPDTALRVAPRNCDAATFDDLTIIARNGEFLR